MKIWLYTIVKNEATFLPYFLRHYASFVDKLIVYDEFSKDGTRELVTACPQAELRDFTACQGFNDQIMVDFANSQYKEARGQADWVIWVDSDELLYAGADAGNNVQNNIRAVLSRLLTQGVNLPLTQGYQMMSEYFPKDTGLPITQLIKTGVADDKYSKVAVFRPELDVVFYPGKHKVDLPPNVVKTPEPVLQLLHYRFLGLGYCAKRNLGNYSRLSPENLSQQLGIETMPGYAGEGGLKWFVETLLPQSQVVL